ncbi:MAG: hypothetical protein OZSIB_4000 [Candidatus Ozemobacter sibiricus]|uniref:Uncharacterized protein n=1 Tax=Candidatus Ozemobacter sibiricus TaxID=2268124 RepID=A0A367ZP87_9BACT|nr:MAG: hypothetical protein OZSIB_4000 [Candidatus Ozemobacter sibiricus]
MCSVGRWPERIMSREPIKTARRPSGPLGGRQQLDENLSTPPRSE